MSRSPVPVAPADIERALVAISPYVRRTPIIEVRGSEIGVDATIVINLEFMQCSGSFKGSLRGASRRAR